jgi:hypothetical protein
MLNGDHVSINQITEWLWSRCDHYHYTVNVGGNSAQFTAVIGPAHGRVAGLLRNNDAAEARFNLPQHGVSGYHGWQIAALKAAEYFPVMIRVAGLNINLLTIVADNQAFQTISGFRLDCRI